MAKMWEGRTSADTSQIADDFNSSIRVDSRMYKADITGSMAHAAMLGECGIIPAGEADAIIDGLSGILDDLESGALQIDPAAEDIHMFVEDVLTKRIGDAGKRLHTARSRNDQVTLDLRMHLRDDIDEILSGMRSVIEAILEIASDNTMTVMPGYTHLQRAQPVTFAHHLMAYAMMFTRDIDRLLCSKKRMNVSPIGCCALAGTTYATDRRKESETLGFDDICLNSLDGVSDRDYVIELVSDLSILMMHLSRLSEEIILWSSWEFRFVQLSDAFTTGSSIMPQKKNSDMAELVRGKTGRVYGHLMGLLTVMKGIPLAYNKDMQEDKEAVFDAVDTVKACLEVFAPMIATMQVLPQNMMKAAQEGFINATDVADYLVRKGLPFRSAYKISGRLVSKCINEGKVLETLTLDEYREFSELFDEDIYDAVDLTNCTMRRISEGGTSPDSFNKQKEFVLNAIKELK